MSAAAALPSRRAVLAAGLLLPFTACTITGCTRDTAPGPPPPADPDIALRAAAVARERNLLELYDGALAASPHGNTVLGPLRAEHATHLAALGVPAAALDPTPASGPSSPAAAGPSPAAPPPSTADLTAAEVAASAGHGRDVLLASRALAALLATLSAAEASHAVALL